MYDHIVRVTAHWRPTDFLVAVVVVSLVAASLVWGLAALSDKYTIQVPSRGGVFEEVIVGSPRFINPVLALSDADRDVTRLTFRGLMQSTDNGIEPDLAESYTVSDDRKTYTFTLRDTTFHDGEPVTAQDVAFTISLIQNQLLKSPLSTNWQGVTATAVDEHTLTLTLENPYAPFLENLTVGILPKHIWKDVKIDEVPFSPRNISAIGSGPYKITDVTKSADGVVTDIKLSAHSDEPEPYIGTVRLHFVANQESLLTMFEKNQNLAAHSIPPSDERTVHEAVLGRIFAVFLNQNKNALFAEAAVREALDAALDKQLIVETLLSGFGSPANGPLPPQKLLTAPVASTSLEAARNILEGAGWVLADGVYQKTVKKETKSLEFTLTTSAAPELKGAAIMVAEMWTALGARVDTQFFEASDLENLVIRDRDYDALLFGEVVGREHDLYAFWHSSQKDDPGLNIAGYANIKVDALLEAARVATSSTAASEKTRQAADIISDEYGALFLYAPHFVYVTPKATNLTLGSITAASDRFNSIRTWYVDTDRVWPIFK
ncbi:MAG: hypothetical protein RLZZ283_427 [Candidatus Parcubacteria bacterium]